MGKYILKRIGYILLVFLLLSFLIFDCGSDVPPAVINMIHQNKMDNAAFWLDNAAFWLDNSRKNRKLSITPLF